MQTQHNPRHLLLYHLSNLTEPSDTLHQAGIGESGVTAGALLWIPHFIETPCEKGEFCEVLS